MLKPFLKSALPHLLAIFIFAIVAIIYCNPALEGKVLQQSDITQWKGMAQDALSYSSKYGQTPLWTTSMFGGMPAFQITGVPGYAYSIGLLDKVFTLSFAEPISLFFLASICFYFLSQVIGFTSLIGIIGALGYAYATYNPIIIVVGHITKMHAIAYLPFFIGSILLIFKKKYLTGAVLTGIATQLFVQSNHYQITYYGLVIVFFMSVYHLIIWVKEKQYQHILKTLLLSFALGLTGVAVNAPMIVSTYEYGKESIRGGSALISKDSKTTSSGLNKDYALSYSIFKSEALVMMFPNLYGGASDPNGIDPATSKAIEVLQQMQPQIAQQLQSFVQLYWGGIGFTAGPPYVGIIVCFFALIGFCSKQNPHRWWVLAAIIFSLMLAAGAYFEEFNIMMLNNLPFYNKFRAPSMILVVPTFLLGFTALYGMSKVLTENNFKAFFTKCRPSFILLGLLFFAVLLIYFNSDFKSENEKQLLNQIAQIQDPNQKAAFEAPANDLVNAIAADRQKLIESDLIHALLFIGLLLLLIFIYYKKIISQTVLFIGIGLLSLIDLFQINTIYLKPSSFIDAAENENAFALTPLDIALKKDPTEYRVLDIRNGIQNAFNGGAIIAYHHKTVGGYNPAKLSIYQDLIENQWYNFPNCLPTLNMLNTKYIISGNMASDTTPNPSALGNAWFVKGIQFEKGPSEVMNKLTYFNPKDTAIIEEKDKIEELVNVQFDSSSSIKLINNNNDELNYISNSSKKQLAVFSEIYYKLGWKAYIDGQETPIVKTNYVLRALVIPAGNHKIRFEFKPISIQYASLASKIASGILWISLISLIVISIKKQTKTK